MLTLYSDNKSKILTIDLYTSFSHANRIWSATDVLSHYSRFSLTDQKNLRCFEDWTYSLVDFPSTVGGYDISFKKPKIKSWKIIHCLVLLPSCIHSTMAVGYAFASHFKITTPPSAAPITPLVNTSGATKMRTIISNLVSLCFTVFENHGKSLIEHCERSELRLHFEWTKS